MIVYLILNTVNGKGYVGQHNKNSISSRWTGAFSGANNSLSRDKNIYGPEVFSKEVLNHCSSKEEMDNLEKLWIIALRTYDPNFGYNVMMGGEVFRLGKTKESIRRSTEGVKNYWKTKSDKERKQHMQKAASFRTYDTKFREKCRQNRKGKKLSLETRSRLSAAHKARYQKEKQLGITHTKHFINSIWINNGVTCRRINKDQIIPQGWMRGRTRFK